MDIESISEEQILKLAKVILDQSDDVSITTRGRNGEDARISQYLKENLMGCKISLESNEKYMRINIKR